MDRACSSTVVRQLYDLEIEKEKLELKLFEEDDRLRGDEYDENKVKQLTADVEAVKKELLKLELHAEVKNLRQLERQRETLKRKRAVHQMLIDMSQSSPPVSLTRSTILISSKICRDCAVFKDKVNRCLGLSIELVECLENKR
jgi:hypothetical protein